MTQLWSLRRRGAKEYALDASLSCAAAEREGSDRPDSTPLSR